MGGLLCFTSLYSSSGANPAVAAWLEMLTEVASPVGIKLVTEILRIKLGDRPTANQVTCKLRFLTL